ncbi:MAG: ABC transporter permease [bacterium]
MFKNYMKIAWRSIFRYKIYSFLNIGGLAIGIASFLFILFYVVDELSYDKHHSKADNIYRVCRLYIANGVEEDAVTLSWPAGPALQNAYPAMIKKYVRFFNFQTPKLMVEYEQKKFNERRFFLADSTVFDVFDYEFVFGNPDGALDRPFTILITESIAQKYFGDENPLGKSLTVERQGEFEITGVIKDLPSQSHLIFDFLASMSTVPQIFGGQFPQTWIWNPCWTYILFEDGVNPDQLTERFPEFHQNHYFDFPNQDITLHLQKLTDIHLHSNLVYEITQNSNITYIYLLSAIAIFILVIASINFMNLATAASAGRAKEIGIKKVLGANRSQLITQFLGESIVTAYLALIVAIIIMLILLTPFNNFAGKLFTPGIFLKTGNLILVIALGIILGISSGMYPAFFLSAFQPVKVLKGTLAKGSKSGFARKILVIVQFTISIALIVGTLVVFRQIRYMRSAELGFNKEHVIALPVFNTGILRQYDAFINEVKQHPQVVNAVGMEDLLGVDHNTRQFFIEGYDPDKPLYYPGYFVKYDFLETFDIQVVAGRSFSREFPADTLEAIMINEAMVQHLGWTNENAIGRSIRSNGNERVVGVFKNFKAMSLHKPESTFILDMTQPRFRGFMRYIGVRVKSGNYQDFIPFLEEKWKQFEPDRPFEYTFLDQEIYKLYNNEEKFGQLSVVLTILAIIIACLGLFGLTSFLATQRTKEIGIRKVLGSTVPGLVYLISRDFLSLVLLSNVIAIPLSFWVMRSWLQNFAYRTSIGLTAFVIAAFAALIIAFLTVSYQAIKTALINPSKALRYE